MIDTNITIYMWCRCCIRVTTLRYFYSSRSYKMLHGRHMELFPKYDAPLITIFVMCGLENDQNIYSEYCTGMLYHVAYHWSGSPIADSIP